MEVSRIVAGRSPGAGVGEDAGFVLHTHPWREICFVAEGESLYRLSGQVFESGPGTAFLIDAWEPHAFGYRRTDGGLRHLWIHFCAPGEGLSAMWIRVGHGGEHRMEGPPVTLPEDLRNILERRWDALNGDPDLPPGSPTEYMLRPLEAVLDEIRFRETHEGTASRSADRSPIAAVKKYIRMSNARGCSLAHLEKIFGYSRYHLAHRFRAEAGCTVGEYIDRVRLEFTEQALKRGLKQKEIAYELGFSSPANFWNWRQRHRGPAA